MEQYSVRRLCRRGLYQGNRSRINLREEEENSSIWNLRERKGWIAMKIKSEEDSWNYWFFNGEEEFKNSLQARGKGED